MKPYYSIVISVYNESLVLPALYEELMKIIGEIKHPYEIIFVNDGSQDESQKILDQFTLTNNNVTVMHFSKNFGMIQHAFTMIGDAGTIAQGAFFADHQIHGLPFFENHRAGF